MTQIARILLALFPILLAGCSGDEKDASNKAEEAYQQEKQAAADKAAELKDKLAALGAKFAPTVYGSVESVNGRTTNDSRQYYISIDLKSATRLTDDDLKIVVELHQTLQIGVPSTALFKNGRPTPKPIRKIGSLNLDSTPITDAAVPHLLKLHGIRSLSIVGTRIGPDGAEALRKAHGKKNVKVGPRLENEIKSSRS